MPDLEAVAARAAEKLTKAAEDAATKVQEAADKASSDVKAIARWLIRTAVGLAIAAGMLVIAACMVVGAAIVVIRKIDDNSTETKQARAEGRHLQCFLAQDDFEIATPKSRAGAEALCEGYTTLEEAYKTEGVPPRYQSEGH